MKYILLIDDSEASNFLNQFLIKSMGFDVNIQTCVNGQDALDFLKCEGKYKEAENYPIPLLILLDINMPIMNGWEFLDEFKSLPVLIKKESVVMMLTTSMNPDDKEKALKNEFISDFITKPLNKEKLSKMIQEHLDA